MSESRSFAGKWQFAAASGQLITVQEDGTLSLSAKQSGVINQMINAYGMTSFWLQAGNGQYLAASGNTPQANQPRDGVVAEIRLEEVGGSGFRLRRISSSGDSYLVAQQSGLIWQAATSSPPMSAQFTRTVVTKSLEYLKDWGAMGADLRFAYLAEENLNEMVMMAVDLSNADLRGSTLLDADLTNVKVDDCNFGGCDLSKTDLTHVHGKNALFEKCLVGSDTNMPDAELPNAIFRGCKSSGGQPILNRLKAPGADFSGALLPSVIMENADLSQANLVNVDLSGASLASCNFTGAIMTLVNLQNTTLQTSNFSQATLVGTDFTGANINHVNFSGANLTNARLSLTTGYSQLNLSDSTLLATVLTEMNLVDATITAKTDFTQAQMDGVNLSSQKLDQVIFLMASMKKANLDSTSLNGAVLVGANLAGATILGNVSLVGANLSNASLENVNLTGAQFGALSTVTHLDEADAQALDNQQLPEQLRQMLYQGKGLINGQAEVLVRQPGQNWLVEHDGKPLFIHYQDGQLNVAQDNGGNAAILANTFMPNAILTGANLYAVDMSGAHWYGSNARADNANLEQVNLSNANLATMNFTQARLFGANLSYANLVNTDFSKAMLEPTQGLKPASLAFASIQGTIFTEAKLTGANLTNGAVALPFEETGKKLTGVPLFSAALELMSSLNSGTVSKELRQVFTDNGYSLLSNAKIIEKQSDQYWIISNQPPDTDLSYRGYCNFVVIRVSEVGNNHLQVCGGSPLRIIRTAADNTLQPVNVAFGVTIDITQAMDGATTCPSGLRYQLLNTGISYQSLMTPGLPPHPPKCIPSPTTWC
ncbi:Secreted effector protein pipB2 [Photorhabdus australis subsp. thailandensis]|uniref:Secreted effector protein pipB2 n=1 Tax=Photorhabdus australis subsp. thailandensis TaxID=2805096 RepID=A0A1C0U5P5_9GAMM|nr:pentapeptide repeat-containing protein [Photorhabdus australis]OCQ53248.1 Secreted effector protein pipB2 [Photorhabdus australis subsp. thailandensis]